MPKKTERYKMLKETVPVSVSYYHMTVDLPDKGFKMEAKDEETFTKDGEGWGVLTDFFIELVSIDHSSVNELLDKYKITVFDKQNQEKM